MDLSIIIAFCGAVVPLALAIGVAFSARSLTHWLFVAGMLLLGAESFFVGLSLNALLPQEVLRWQQWRFTALSLIPGAWLLFSQLYAREKRTALLSKTRWLPGAAFLLPLAIVVLSREQLVSAVGEPTPGALWVIALGRSGVWLNLCVLVTAVVILMNLERTYRAAVGTMQWRIKFMVIGLAVLFALRAFTSSQAVLFKAISLSLQALDSSALLLACLLILRTLARTGHFEVGVYVSRSVLQGSLALLFAGVYLVVLGIAANLKIGEGAAFQLKAFAILVALSFLAILLLSDRARLHARRFISRHFERPMYDYRQVWRTFVQRTARCVEQATLCTAIANTVSEVFQTLSVHVWLLDPEKTQLSLRASTAVPTSAGQPPRIEGAEASGIMHALAGKSDPVDIDVSKEAWAEPLRRSQPSQFPHGGNRVCVPIAAAGDLLGLMLVGDRVAGVRYSTQDYELLKTLADQAAASLLNLQLSEKLSQAKQLEAFQAMSAFFVHDLKNTASSLSLMLRNFPVHYQNPEFREDALRGLGNTVGRLNGLIERLNMLRHELQLHEVECDLNQVVTDALQSCGASPGVQLVKELAPLPKIRLDPLQVQKVVTNLVLNAREAVGETGEVRIETSLRNGWVVLAVKDNGCGMSPEFIRDSLFRPFQSTKQKGMGIGMFHCKIIVEAHRGRMEVESTPGKGTKFQVLLPI